MLSIPPFSTTTGFFVTVPRQEYRPPADWLPAFRRATRNTVICDRESTAGHVLGQELFCSRRSPKSAIDLASPRTLFSSAFLIFGTIKPFGSSATADTEINLFLQNNSVSVDWCVHQRKFLQSFNCGKRDERHIGQFDPFAERALCSCWCNYESPSYLFQSPMLREPKYRGYWSYFPLSGGGYYPSVLSR